jgi:hypothetical protein
MEVLTAMVLSGVLLSLAARDFGFVVGERHDLDLLVETQHGLRAALSEITRELRQAGACLPVTGDFTALDGEDNGTQDRLTVRVGRVNPNDIVCVRTILTEEASAGSSLLSVEDSGQFAVGQLVYLVHNDGSARLLEVAGVGAGTISISGRLDRRYPVGAGVFGVEERTYEVDTSSGSPILTLAIDGREPQPLVDGVERFDVRYLLAPCPPCAAVNEPASETEWYLVREVRVDVGILSRVPRRDGTPVRLSGATTIRPRNLL